MDNAEKSESVDDVEPEAWEIFAGLLTAIIKARMEKPFTEDELNTIAGV